MVGIDRPRRFVIDAFTMVAGLMIDKVFSKPAHVVFEYYRSNKIEIVAPVLLSYEVTNAIRTAVIRKRVLQKDVTQLIKAYKKFKIAMFEPDEGHIVSIALETNISTYDSTYLSLAIANNIPLISADKKLFTAMNLHSYKKNLLWISDFESIAKEKLN